MGAMKLLRVASILVLAALLALTAAAQSPEPNPAPLDLLLKKVDETNAKLDALSQQILKIEQQLSTTKPGVMIGEATPIPAAATAAGTMSDPVKATSPATGNSHIIAKGETLTSIAKAYKVGVEDLQKFNHIENDRKLQVGQTIMIPTGATAPSPTPSAPAP